jgi:hypothetical protein
MVDAHLRKHPAEQADFKDLLDLLAQAQSKGNKGNE